MSPTPGFERWALGFSGCDGGDLGSPQRPSTWICGIEWGGGHDRATLVRHVECDVDLPSVGYGRWEENLAYIFNWQAMKLLAAIDGDAVASYKAYAERVAPFVEGRLGFFKLNLYPLAFKNTSASRWNSDFAEISGLPTKQTYMAWCQAERFPRMRQWAAEALPRLIICLGKTYADDFAAAFLDADRSFNVETVAECELRWARNRENSLVVVLPFMVNRHGLVKNAAIQSVGERIATLLSQPAAQATGVESVQA